MPNTQHRLQAPRPFQTATPHPACSPREGLCAKIGSALITGKKHPCPESTAATESLTVGTHMESAKSSYSVGANVISVFALLKFAV